MGRPALPGSRSIEVARTVVEHRIAGPVPLFRHPEWESRFPWLAQGTSGRGEGDDFDLGAFGESAIGATLDRWTRLREATGTRTVVHARQVHGAEVGVWDCDLPAGLLLTDGLDAHLTDRPGLLLAVSVADCVPIFIVAEEERMVALVHAGWRGVAGGALEAAVGALQARGIDPAELWLHCGPSICGACYEVGPEVHRAVHPDRPSPARPTPIDLRRALGARAHALGVSDERISLSAHCTLCGPGDFFSHRGGSAGRQMGVLARVE